jgi:TonB family protein
MKTNGRHLSTILGPLGFAFFFFLNPSVAKGQNKHNNCNHQPKILSEPSFSDQDRAKWKGKLLSGKVALVISENGDVADARVLSASPREAAEALLDAVKRAKFAPRLGCGELKTEVIFTLNR